jgi:hypothetical protein
VETFSGLSEALVVALRPRTVGERVRARIVGGWSARQVLARLPSDLVAAWVAGGGEDPIVRERRLADAVHAALLDLTHGGQVRRQVARYGVELRSKGHRYAVVDVFRLA